VSTGAERGWAGWSIWKERVIGARSEARAGHGSPENHTILMASNGENAIFLQIIEDSGLGQLWRITNLLFRVRNGALAHKDVKNEDRPGDVYEKKGGSDKMADHLSGLLAENSKI